MDLSKNNDKVPRPKKALFTQAFWFIILPTVAVVIICSIIFFR